MDTFEKQAQIQSIAENDFSYTAWYRIFRESEKTFEDFVNRQQEDVRTILWSYAQSGRMMNQMLLSIACEHMVFPSEN